MKRTPRICAFVLLLAFVLPLILTGCGIENVFGGGIAGVYENEHVTLTFAKDNTLRIRSDYCIALGEYYLEKDQLILTINGVSKTIPFSKHDDTLILTLDAQMVQELGYSFTSSDTALILQGNNSRPIVRSFASIASGALGSLSQYNTLKRCNGAPKTAAVSDQTVKLSGSYAFYRADPANSILSMVELSILWNDLTFETNGEVHGHPKWSGNNEAVGSYSVSGNELTYEIDGETHKYQIETTDDELWFCYGSAGVCFQSTSPNTMSLPDDEELSFRMLDEDTIAVTGKGVMAIDSGYNALWADYAHKVKNAVIGDGITEIASSAFCSFDYLSRITVGNSVTRIGKGSFQNCCNLKEITLPMSLKTIEDMAFRYCDRLTDIYYKGTVQQWNDIQIAADNEELKAVCVHCSDADYTMLDQQTASQQESAPESSTISSEQTPVGKKRAYSKRKIENFSLVIPADWTAKTEAITEMWDTPQTSEQFRCYDAAGNLVLDFDYQTSGVGVTQIQIVENGVSIEYYAHDGIISGGFLGSHLFMSYGLTQDQLTEILSTAEFYNRAEDFPVPTRTLEQGANGEDVRYVQAALMELNYDGIVTDGDYGKYTADAVSRFQKNHKMEPTGIVDAATAQELQDALVAWRQKH